MKPPPRKGSSGNPRPPRPASPEDATVGPAGSGDEATVRPRPSPEQAGGPGRERTADAGKGLDGAIGHDQVLELHERRFVHPHQGPLIPK